LSNFFVLFDGKEGTSHLMILLDQFTGVSIVHQTDGRGWEPFDWHLHQSLSINALMRYLNLVFAPGDGNAAKLNKIYTHTADRRLDHYDKSGAVGFKMRFALPAERGPVTRLIARWGPDWLNQLRIDQRWYERRLLSLLVKHEVVVLFAVRQDLFRWALSKYHGDGTGRDGHLQFEIASGNLRRSQVPAIEVDPARFQETIDDRRCIIDEKKRLMIKMQRLGIKTAAIVYEEFLSDPHAYFHKLFRAIGHKVSDLEISEVLKKGTPFKKVHSEDISEFVVNHREIEAQFGECVINFEEEKGRRTEKKNKEQ
jgi:hypothetical protein